MYVRRLTYSSNITAPLAQRYIPCCNVFTYTARATVEAFLSRACASRMQVKGLIVTDASTPMLVSDLPLVKPLIIGPHCPLNLLMQTFKVKPPAFLLYRTLRMATKLGRSCSSVRPTRLFYPVVAGWRVSPSHREQ
jgi:hypothetical protein